MIKLNVVCFGNPSGYSQAAQDLILSLHPTKKYDIRIEYLFARGMPQQGLSPSRKKMFEEFMQKPKTDNDIQIYFCVPHAQHNIKRTKRVISFATFETYQPPNSQPIDWISILNRGDAVFTPSQFNYRIFAHEKLKVPLFYVPACFDSDLYNPNVDPEAIHSKFTFLYFATFRMRKGYPQLFEAFLKEFNADENVQLLIKTDKTQEAKAYLYNMKKKLKLEHKPTPDIIFEERILSDQQMPKFMKSVDCLISPTLGEGFGLPGLQSMALGVPVAITDFSGCQDYANNDTATLIKPAGFVLQDCLDNLPQFHHRKWPLITLSEVRKALRYTFENKQLIQEKATYASLYVKERFSYEKSAFAFEEMMKTVFPDLRGEYES